MRSTKNPDGSDYVDLYGGKYRLTFAPKDHKYFVSQPETGDAMVEVASVTTINSIIDKGPVLMRWAAECGADYYRTEMGALADQLSAELADVKDGGEVGVLERYVRMVFDEVYISEFADKIKWAHRNLTRTSASIGTVAHKFAEDVIGYKLGRSHKPRPPINKEASRSAKAFLGWADHYKVKFIESEFRVYSASLGYAGTVDIEATVGDERCVCDLKTSKDVYEEHISQVGAYAAAVAEERGEKYEAGWIIRIDKQSGDFKAIRIPGDDLREAGERFAGYLQAWKSREWFRGALARVKAGMRSAS